MVGHQQPGGLGGQWAQVHESGRRVWKGEEPLDLRPSGVAAAAEDPSDRLITQPPRQRAQAAGERRIGMMDVVQDHEDGSPRRTGIEEGAERPPWRPIAVQYGESEAAGGVGRLPQQPCAAAAPPALDVQDGARARRDQVDHSHDLPLFSLAAT
ncbi:hypothetical protein GCM10022419_112410 [Nonomuraea rosea]|uniref:Uncharacterized protein n=1 Tax=Nonomuraea rosea TaxID=638574 RepID=A0ABP6ZGI1_9ACTN